MLTIPLHYHSINVLWNLPLREEILADLVTHIRTLGITIWGKITNQCAIHNVFKNKTLKMQLKYLSKMCIRS